MLQRLFSRKWILSLLLVSSSFRELSVSPFFSSSSFLIYMLYLIFFNALFFLVHLDSFLSYSGLSSLLFILKGNFWGFFFIVQASTQITSCLIRPFLPYYSSWKETSRASFYCSGIRLDNFLSYQADSGSLFLTIHHKRRLLWHLFTV